VETGGGAWHLALAPGSETGHTPSAGEAGSDG